MVKARNKQYALLTAEMDNLCALGLASKNGKAHFALVVPLVTPLIKIILSTDFLKIKKFLHGPALTTAEHFTNHYELKDA